MRSSKTNHLQISQIIDNKFNLVMQMDWKVEDKSRSSILFKEISINHNHNTMIPTISSKMIVIINMENSHHSRRILINRPIDLHLFDIFNYNYNYIICAEE